MAEALREATGGEAGENGETGDPAGAMEQVTQNLEEISERAGARFVHTPRGFGERHKAQVLEMGKPEQMVEKIAEGKMNKFFKESCLMNQQYVKEPDKTIADYLNEVIARTGEKITIKRFARFQIGSE